MPNMPHNDVKRASDFGASAKLITVSALATKNSKVTPSITTINE